MPLVRVALKTSGLLGRRVRQIQLAAAPDSPAAQKLAVDMKRIVETGYRRMILASQDRFGRPLAPLAPSTLRNKKRGPDPRPLIPHGMASRFIQNVEWAFRDGVSRLVGVFNFTTKDGRNFAQYHILGGPNLPQRDIGGLDPRTRRETTDRFARFRDELIEEKRED